MATRWNLSYLLWEVDKFDSSKEEWPQYHEWLLHSFQENDIDTAGKKRAVLLFVVGLVMYILLSNLLAPAKPGEKTYGELVMTSSAHYSPSPSEIIQRFKFHSCFHNPSESVAIYLCS